MNSLNTVIREANRWIRFKASFFKETPRSDKVKYKWEHESTAAGFQRLCLAEFQRFYRIYLFPAIQMQMVEALSGNNKKFILDFAAHQ